jgi:hypothetical protein
MWIAALVAALAPAGAAHAGAVALVGATPSAFALPIVDAGLEGPTLALSTTGEGPRSEALVRTRFDGVRYRPRGRVYRDRDRAPASPVLSTVHVGFFDPSGGFGSGFDMGFRFGPLIDPHIQLGGMIDWWHKSESQTMSVGGGEFPIGGTFEQQREISHFSANLFPMMGFIQLSGDDNMSVIPYGGAGVGYEALFLSGAGRDALDQPFEFDANYGGFGWQVWGGVAVPLSGQARLGGEVFGNFAELSRDVEDSFGDTIREIVKVDGVGARVGVTWGF